MFMYNKFSLFFTNEQIQNPTKEIANLLLERFCLNFLALEFEALKQYIKSVISNYTVCNS